MTTEPPPRPLGEPPPAAEEPAERALRRLLRTQLEAMEAERPKLLSPADPEPLHDFRVALRRARSLLKEMGDVLPARAVRKLMGELEWLGTATGPSRDLDVMVAAIGARSEALPEWVRIGLNPLLRLLYARKEEAMESLSEILASERLRQLMGRLDALSERRPTASRAAAPALRPIGELADERIWKAARRVTKRGRALGASPAAPDLHRLRIACKRLRYLLEFFHSLYPPRQAAALIQALRRLQDLLGSSNDLAVEEERLRELSPLLPGPDSLLAVGFLLAVLELEKREIDGQIRPALRAFLGRHNQERLRRLTRAEEPR